MGGLAAALIYRGLRLCYVPTTLMAVTDTMLSKFPTALVADWLRAEGFRE